MLRFVVALMAIGWASAALHGVCHSNHLQHTEEQVVNSLADLCDRDSNGIIQEGEVVVAFSEILGSTLPLPEADILAMDYQALLGIAGLFGFSVDRQEFIHSWHARFHDNHEFIAATFDAFDDDTNGVWSIQEVDGILNHIKATSVLAISREVSRNYDGDGIISRAEFVAYFTAIYKNC